MSLNYDKKKLQSLSKRISCNFVDTRTTSKDYTAMVAKRLTDKQTAPSKNTVTLSTCLRYESYDLSGSGTHFEPAFYVSGPTCMKRLISLLSGLQSEIVGEKEILLQATSAIEEAYASHMLDEDIYDELQEALALAEALRETYSISNTENYSTIASDIAAGHIEKNPDSTIAIVGGGYMADKFFGALLKIQPLNIRKIIWINRSTGRIERYVSNLIHMLDCEVEIVNLDEGLLALIEADIVFGAISNSPVMFKDARLKKGSLVIDVSYPRIFSDNKNAKVLNISNTQFSQLVRNPVSYENINKASTAIDTIIHALSA